MWDECHAPAREECVRVVNLQGKVGSRTLHFNDVCRTVGEEALRDFFNGHGAVEYLELFRAGEDEGGGQSKAGGVVRAYSHSHTFLLKL